MELGIHNHIQILQNMEWKTEIKPYFRQIYHEIQKNILITVINF
jgi:hypothetical protein